MREYLTLAGIFRSWKDCGNEVEGSCSWIMKEKGQEYNPDSFPVNTGLSESNELRSSRGSPSFLDLPVVVKKAENRSIQKVKLTIRESLDQENREFLLQMH